MARVLLYGRDAIFRALLGFIGLAGQDDLFIGRLKIKHEFSVRGSLDFKCALHLFPFMAMLVWSTSP
jgi:hypothetical protein